MPLDGLIDGVAEIGTEAAFGSGNFKFGCLILLLMLSVIGVVLWIDYSLCDDECEGIGEPEDIGDVCMCLQEDGSYVKPD